MRIDEIVNHVFTRAFMGYDIEQVDVFLDEIIETLERYEAEKREMLAAMEYLMRKLEHGQKVPFADMKKEIDSGRRQGNAALPGGELAQDEQKPAARSISRGNGANKPIRAPKVNRVKREEEAKAQIIEEAKAAIPQEELTQDEADRRAKRMSAAAVNWLDELLINIAEHETRERETPDSAQQATQPAEEPKVESDANPQSTSQPTPQPAPKATYSPKPAPKATYTPKPASQPTGQATPVPKPQEPLNPKLTESAAQQPATQTQENDAASMLQKIFQQADHDDE